MSQADLMANKAGKAYLVGAGPGRADLITVRGLSLLRTADVVIYDRLIDTALLEEAPPTATRIFVGKSPSHHSHPQDETSAILVEQVRAGAKVVRLKGGDPFVFGRGGEEALSLADAGLSFEIVPGVSSAVAVPAYAGIPVTQRGLTTSFAVVAGHESPDKVESEIDWKALATIPTLVILMGTRSIARIAEVLIESGRAPETPAAAIYQGTTKEQRSIRTALAELPAAMAAAEMTPPVVIIIGEVARLSDRLAWFRPEQKGTQLVSLFEQSDSIGTPFRSERKDMINRREVVLVGHGSPVPEAVDEFLLFSKSLAHHLDHPVRSCFLELSEPSMGSVFAQAAKEAGRGGELLVVPMLLGSAFHMKTEITEAARELQGAFPDVKVRLSTPLGFHLHLAELLEVRVREALARTPGSLPPDETTVLLVGGGSSDPDSNSSVAKVARVLFELGGYAGVEVAYQRVTHPTTTEGIERVHRLGAKQIVVAPYLLFTGIVYGRMAAEADAAAARLGRTLIHARYLGPTHPLLVRVAAQRLQEAADGTSALFRHKAIEGLPQVRAKAHSHHHHHGDHHHHHDAPSDEQEHLCHDAFSVHHEDEHRFDHEPVE